MVRFPRKKKTVLNLETLDAQNLSFLVILCCSYGSLRVPAERCISLASRIARCRDSSNQTMQRNLHYDVVKLVGCPSLTNSFARNLNTLLISHSSTGHIAPEIVAVLPRVQNTIAIPFMIDYIRRYGEFSKQFIAEAVDKSLERRLFDFVR